MLQRGLSVRSSVATGSYAAGGCVKSAGLTSPAYSAAKTFHRFHAAFKSLCIRNAGCVFFTLALCARTAAWSPSHIMPYIEDRLTRTNIRVPLSVLKYRLNNGKPEPDDAAKCVSHFFLCYSCLDLIASYIKHSPG
jgi:hypothetical protein